jgi:phosphoglycerate dehydrogenase-like enzyme
MKVLIAENYATSSLARLKGTAGFSITDKWSEAEALLIRSQTRVDEELLSQAPQLRLVVTATSGFDHIDWRACENRNVTAAYTPEANAASTAELTVFLMSALLRQTISQMENARQGRWREGLKRGDALEGKTLGIIGLGRVGRRVASLAKAYDMKIVAHDPYVDNSAFDGIERMSFIEVLRAADVVSLHVPLTKQTKHMINLATLQEIPRGSFLLNMSRGACVDESEVLVALRTQRLAGVAFDVMEREPPLASNELLRHPSALVTPHVGAFTSQAFERASNAAVDRVIRFAQNQPISDTLPLATPWFEHCV